MTTQEYDIKKTMERVNDSLHENIYTLRKKQRRNGATDIVLYRKGIMIARGRIYIKNYLDHLEKELEKTYEPKDTRRDGK